jgi:hypothetical protein
VQINRNQIADLIRFSIALDEKEKAFWLSKIDILTEEQLIKLQEIFASEKVEFKKLIQKIYEFDPEGKILAEFNRVITGELKKMRNYIEEKEKAGADVELEKVLKNV